jgi:hypothetical protein
MDFKPVLWTVVGTLIALIAYDMFVKKALKIETFESYETID